MLITFSSVALAVLTPVFHCHQFGEPSRMARDAGFSCLLTGGVLYAAFGAVRTFRREAESGTLHCILSHPVSHFAYFLSKTVGCAIAYLIFAITLSGVVLTVANGFEIGGRIAAVTGDIVRIWGPSLAVGVATLLMPVIAGAALNRFAHRRFTLWTTLLMLASAVLGTLLRPDAALYLRMLPALVLFAMPPVAVLSAAAAFAARFRTNVASAGIVGAVMLLIPALGNYCLSDAIANGRSIPPAYFGEACLAMVPAVVFFLVLGAVMIRGRDAI